MKYSALMNAVDPIKALALLDMEAKPNGSWIKFPCSCGKEAVLKAYGEKKNVWYCPECKDKGHIISLTMARKTLSYEEATQLLEDKTVVPSQGKVKEELKLKLTLEYHPMLEEKGITDETAAFLEFGQAKGRNVLSGHMAFRVEDEEGMKIAYYGLHLETGKPNSSSTPNSTFTGGIPSTRRRRYSSPPTSMSVSGRYRAEIRQSATSPSPTSLKPTSKCFPSAVP